MEVINKKRWVNQFLVFLFCLAIIFGPAYALFDSYNYDVIANPDLKTYLGLADFNFDQHPVRKYRIVIPLLAGGINYIFGPMFSLVAPVSFPGPNFSLCLGFLLVNCIFMSVFGVFVYRLCKEYGASRFAATIGLLSVLTCRWTSYLAGLPLIDSLLMVVLSMMLYGIKTKNTTLIVCSIFIGPWAKESFLFFAPIIFFFSHLDKKKQVGLFLLSGLLIFSFRFLLDKYSNASFQAGIKSDLEHLENITVSLKRLFSFHGLYEVFSILGIWALLGIGLLNKKIRMVLQKKTAAYFYIFLLIVLGNALLSTELARMFYMATPILVIWFSIIATEFFKELS
jgi:hypothetical protein